MSFCDIEDSLYNEGHFMICGVDEAGRGPLAGPVYAGAVIMPRGLAIPGLADSKKLSAARREELYAVITETAVAYAVGAASVEEIEELNILNATYLAMNRAIEKLEPSPELALIDGNRSSGIRMKNMCIVGGDAICASIAAASIIAKVSRDAYMVSLCREYPQYGFDKHKGYGTKLHYELIEKYGVCDVHRRSFLKDLLRT